MLANPDELSGLEETFDSVRRNKQKSDQIPINIEEAPIVVFHYADTSQLFLRSDLKTAAFPIHVNPSLPKVEPYPNQREKGFVKCLFGRETEHGRINIFIFVISGRSNFIGRGNTSMSIGVNFLHPLKIYPDSAIVLLAPSDSHAYPIRMANRTDKSRWPERLPMPPDQYRAGRAAQRTQRAPRKPAAGQKFPLPSGRGNRDGHFLLGKYW